MPEKKKMREKKLMSVAQLREKFRELRKRPIPPELLKKINENARKDQELADKRLIVEYEKRHAKICLASIELFDFEFSFRIKRVENLFKFTDGRLSFSRYLGHIKVRIL